MNQIRYIIFDPAEGVSIGFDTAEQATAFLESQSRNIDWQAQWEVERVFAYGEFHWTARINKYVTLNFGTLAINR